MACTKEIMRLGLMLWKRTFDIRSPVCGSCRSRRHLVL